MIGQLIGRWRNRSVLIPVVVCLTVSSAIACKLPVFRYALERWAVDRYRVVALIDGESNEQVRSALAELERAAQSDANILVETVDLSQLSEAQLWQVEGLDGDVQTPCLQVFFPTRNGRRKLCWQGELTAEAVRDWCDSKLRRQIVGDITSGVTAVWVLVDGRDVDENDRIAGQLQSALDRASAEISIPEGVISRQDASVYFQEHPGASMDDVLRCDIPLKIEFTLRRLDVANEEESALRSIISGWNGDRDSPHDGAVVFPVFGRGRMIEPLAAERFSEESVVAACHYMVGECNCTMKALNPGVDLILNANWREFLGDSVVIVDRSLPSTPEIVAIPDGGQQQGTVAVVGEPMRKPDHLRAILGMGLMAIVACGLWRSRKSWRPGL